ncbi:MAG: ABC transporter ATP-binding protein [Hyphomicrobiales bacterium]|nr:ABC transporter ATP-binding protein [Hyphomicrobiales bacterium]
MEQDYAVEAVAITKRFGATMANRGVDLRVRRGTIHGLVGENGAGKSTLMSILFGFYGADSGEIRVNGATARIRSPGDAMRLGLGMVHQHFMLVEAMSVIDNIMLGAEGGLRLRRGAKAVREKLAVLARDYDLVVDPDALVASLDVGQRQRVELLKALVRDARILILDEPTSVLTPDETAKLFTLLRRLHAEGRTIVLITHKLREVLELTSEISVMRAGQIVASLATSQTTAAELAEAMVGRKVALRVSKNPGVAGERVLEARDLCLRGADGSVLLDHVGLELHAGEIVGIAGVSGNGQSELLEVLAGLIMPQSGTLAMFGHDLPPGGRHPARLRAEGVMHVPEDRQGCGLVMPFSASQSALLGYAGDRAFGGLFMNQAAINADCRAKMQAFDVRPPDPDLVTSGFSGGNQQKLVLAREILRHPKILLIGQPTRGVDIGAIEFIHKQIVALRDAGVAVLLVSVELDEILALADRILVMCNGRISGERRPEMTSERDLGLLMAGINAEAA